jgi:hypothetical protein
MSLGDPITPEDIECIRKRWAATRTPSGDSAITVARIDIRLLLSQLDEANARADYLLRDVKAERTRILSAAETLIERLSYVATFDDGTQERVLNAAALEVQLHAMREP